MDNLTHSLAGALLGQLGLKRLTPLAMPALLIGANLPDIDAVATLLGTRSLAIRRGVTHGPLAMLLLPLLLAAAMQWWGRRKGREIRPPGMLLIACLAVWSHPALDWLNSYGIRLLEPFSSRWYAADTLFIIDPWLWAALAGAVLLSLRWERRADPRWRTPAIVGLTAILGYIAANGLITRKAEAITVQAVADLVPKGGDPQIRRWLYRPGISAKRPVPTVRAELVVANPVPLRFWRRTMLWRGQGLVGSGDYDWLRESDSVILENGGQPDGMDDPRLASARRRDPDVRAYLVWSRMPMVIEADGQALLTDQRFAGRLGGLRFAVPLDRR